MQKFLVAAAKIVLSALIVAYLLVRATSDGAFHELLACSRNWWELAAAFAAGIAAVVLIHIRWCLLVRALDIPFTFKTAFRIGFLGYLVNLAPMGIVGGDFIRSLMLIRQSPSQRARAVASVLVDRVVGLYLLFVVAATAILCTHFWRRDEQIFVICMTTLALTVVGGVGLVILFLPGSIVHQLTGPLYRVPRVGPKLRHVIEAIRMYRHCLGTLLTTSLMSICVHLLTVLCVYFLACGLYAHDRTPSLYEQLVVVPLSTVTSVIPLPMGPFEWVLEALYTKLGMVAHEGLIVALAYRLVTVATAALGMGYYFLSRGSAADVLSVERGVTLDALALPANNNSRLG